MKNGRKLNTYQSITICCHHNNKSADFGSVYISVESCNLKQHFTVDYKEGKRAMAQLMLKLGKMPTINHFNDFTAYDLHGFLD